MHRTGIILTFICTAGLTVAAPAAAQSTLGVPHAGTPLVCCTAWNVSVVSGWPLPHGGPPQAAFTFPESWPVLTIVATPENPRGDQYTYWIPGTGAELFVWDPNDSYASAGWRSPIHRIQSWRFPLVVQNAVGGQFHAGGVAQVYHAGHLPDIVKVYVKLADGSRTRDMTVRIR